MNAWEIFRVRLAGIALVLLGLAIIVLPRGGVARHRRLAGVAGGALKVSPASRADAPGVIALIGRVFDEYGFIYDPAMEVADLLHFEAHYEAPRGTFFVVRRGNRVVGSVGAEQLDPSTAELHRLYLEADLRGRGRGRALVEAVIDWCRSRAISRLILWSDTRFEPAHRLYTRMGFRRIGERELAGDANQTREYLFERSV